MMVWKRVRRATKPVMRSPLGWRNAASGAYDFRMGSSCLVRRSSTQVSRILARVSRVEVWAPAVALDRRIDARTVADIRKKRARREVKMFTAAPYTLLVSQSLSGCAVLKLFVPGHLNGFELAFVGSFGIALEIR